LLQVNRHHWNALKYTVSMTVVVSSNLPPFDLKVWLWGLCAVAATIFSSYWDFRFDFGLGDRQHGYLRKHLSIKPRLLGTNVYYVVVVVNVLLRCSWVLSITSPGEMGITIDTELMKVSPSYAVLLLTSTRVLPLLLLMLLLIHMPCCFLIQLTRVQVHSGGFGNREEMVRSICVAAAARHVIVNIN
jgi:hypothetical protein